MPRPLRYELTDVPQHVVQRGNNRQLTFFRDRDYQVYQQFLGGAAQRHRCEVHAYVLMSNHVHLLVTPREPMAIAKLMQSVGRRYVRYINDCHGRSGTLWEGRYKASLVDSDSYLLNCYRYIELNPVRAGLASDPAGYPWSSFRRNAWTDVDVLVTDHAEYAAFGETPAERAEVYRELFQIDVGPDVLEDIRSSLNECRAFGSDHFKTRVEGALKRHIVRRKPGRKKRDPGSAS